MTKPHRATPEQWESIELYAEDNVYDACFLELRARIEALEATQQLRTFTAEEVAPIVVPISPAESLVRRVAGRIGMLAGFDNWEGEARAAILEVAAWLTENYASDVDGPPPHQMLRDEVNR
jgi:hypothetical protein